MFKFTWLFWLLVLVLFAESWARVWAATYRCGERRATNQHSLTPDA